MIVGFEQDQHPDAPPGAGYAVADSGERAYVYDPNLAAQFQAAPAAPPPMQAPQEPSYDLMSAADAGLDQSDPRLAWGNAKAGQDFNSQNLAVDTQGPQGPPPSVADVAPNMSSAPAAGPNMSAAPPQGPNMSSTGPQSSQANAPAGPPPEVDPDEQLRAQLQAGVNAPVYQAPVKGGLRPKSAEVTSEGAEAPMEAADWRELQDANEAIAQTQVTKAAVLRAQAENQIASAQAQLPALQQQYEENQSRLDQARAAAKQDLAKVNGLLQEVSTKKIDHHRLFLHSGFVGGMFAAIAQALGAGAAILGRTGHNMVKEQMDTDLANDIAEQREEIENGRASANNALQMLRDRYNFDIPQAESALKIAQLGVQNAQLQQFEGMKLSQDAQLGLEQWMAQNKKEQFLEARKLYTASVGKQTRKESLTYQQGSAGGYRAPTDVERGRRLDLIEKAQKVGAIEKPGEGEKPLARNLVIQSLDGTQVEARTEKEAQDIRKMRGLQLSADRSAQELEKLSTVGQAINPATFHKYVGHLEAMVNSANTLFGQGVVRGEDLDRWRNQILGDQYGIGAAEAAKEMREIINNAYQSHVDAQMGARVNEDFGRKGAPRARYSGQRATTPTITPRGATVASDNKKLMDELAKYGQGATP